MNGNNRSFTSRRRHFLEQNSLFIDSRQNPTSPFNGWNPNAAPPVYNFDIENFPPGTRLRQFNANQAGRRGGNPISAYWLDYIPGQIVTLQLGNAAQYLFTPALDGCYIGVGNGFIAHVAGDVPGAGATAAMRAIASNSLGGPVQTGFDSNTANAPQVTFVGVRKHGAWRWYAQGRDYFINNHGALEPVFTAGAHAGQNVIRLTDMTYG